MAATERRFSDPAPDRLYLDSDIIINHIVAGQPHHERCRAFLERLAQEGRTKLYLSPISWMEITHTVCRERFRSALSEAQQREHNLRHWGHRPAVRQSYLAHMLGRVERLLGDFEWYEVPVTAAVRVAAVAILSEYNVDEQDVLHLACAAGEQIPDVASLDEKYRRVDGMILWNDFIHLHPGARLGR